MNQHPSALIQTDSEADRPDIARVSRFEILSWLIEALLALVGLVLLSPAFLLIAALIKLADGGSVFYRGERVGNGERIFRIYKFRTLMEGAEQKIGARLINAEDRKVHYSRIGRFLKRTKLDELPQLFNVILGDMRLAGPRPLRPIFLQDFKREIPNYARRFAVPPGITGIAQLRGGYYTPPRNKLRYDLIYIKNRCLFLDFKLVLLTFVKILNRWLSAGFFILFLFLFVSLVPASSQLALFFSLFGTEINLAYVFIIVVATGIFLKNSPSRFTFYRCPLNLPLLLFLVLGILSAAFSAEPYDDLRGAGYYAVTGFLVSLMIVNNEVTKGFIAWMIRIIALTSVFISLLGLFQIFILNHAYVLASDLVTKEKMIEDYTRLSSTLGNPVVLSVYLVLGIPLLLSEVSCARTQRERDFWLVCATISFVGIFFTQTRVGLFALLVTGTVFLSRRLSHAVSFLGVFLLSVLFLISLGVPRFSVPRMHGEVTKWLSEKTPVLRTIPARQWLIGGSGPIKKTLRSTESPDSHLTSAPEEEVSIQNMHVTWILERGVIGWVILMWIIFSALMSMKRAYNRIKDPELRVILWAIISSVLGFLVSMNAMNTFHNLTLQIFFWSLIGIGLGIVIQLNGHWRQNLIWRFGDAGD